MLVTIVPPERLHVEWQNAAGFLDKAVKATRHLRADHLDLYELCLSGASHLWLVLDDENGNEIIGAFTTQMIVYPQYKCMSVPFLGGRRMREWVDQAVDLIAKWGRENGCKTMEGYGRMAWTRFLRSNGFKQAYVVVEKDLEDVPDGTETAVDG